MSTCFQYMLKYDYKKLSDVPQSSQLDDWFEATGAKSDHHQSSHAWKQLALPSS